MKKGILVYDKADAEYNKWFIERIITMGAKKGLDIKLLLSEDVLCGSEGAKYDNKEPLERVLAPGDIKSEFLNEIKNDDFAIMRNRNRKMNEFLESKGIRCFNSSYVCKIGNDKWEMYRDFQTAGIPVMYTQQSRLPFPFIMKPRDGHGGENVFLVNNIDEYENIVKVMHNHEKTDAEPSDSANMSSNIDKFIYQMPASEKGRDIRVYIVGNTILTAMERRADAKSDEFRANFSLGGSAKEHVLTDDELKLAAKVADYIKADFVGIDLIYNNDKPVVNEIEDAVGTRMLYQETDIDAVDIFLDWVVSELEN